MLLEHSSYPPQMAIVLHVFSKGKSPHRHQFRWAREGRNVGAPLISRLGAVISEISNMGT